MLLKDKKVLITGAGGFIGSHLVEHVLESGASVRAFVKYNGRNDWGMLDQLAQKKLDKLEVFMGNICDPFATAKAVEGCDIVFHLAALIGIPYSYVAPADYVMVNVMGTANVLEACKRYSVQRVIHTSTSETYGTAQYTPIDERHPLQGQSPYSASKIGADKLAEAYFRSFDLPVVTVRPFNTFGPRQSARAFIPTVISQVLNGQIVKLGSLEPVRDLTYVKDTVRGFVKVGMCEQTVGKTVNLGVGKGYTVGEVADLIIEIIGKKDVKIEQEAGRVRPSKSEVMKLISDNNTARELAGWLPEYDLKSGLQETISWVRNNLELFKTEKYVI
jgi:NAD dependent epimerase/dehydratase